MPRLRSQSSWNSDLGARLNSRSSVPEVETKPAASTFSCEDPKATVTLQESCKRKEIVSKRNPPSQVGDDSFWFPLKRPQKGCIFKQKTQQTRPQAKLYKEQQAQTLFDVERRASTGAVHFSVIDSECQNLWTLLTPSEPATNFDMHSG